MNICEPPDFPLLASTIALNDLTDTNINFPSVGDVLYYDGSEWINQAVVTTDEQVKVSANDTTADYLLSKLVAGTNIALTEQNDGGNETILIDATGLVSALDDLSDVILTAPTNGQILSYNGSEWVNISAGVDELVKVSANDTTAGYLFAKIIAGTGITLTEINDGGDEDLEVSLTNPITSIDDIPDVDTTTTPPNLNDVLTWDGANWVPGAAGDDGDWDVSGTDVIAILGGNVLPDVTGAQDLGSTTKRWNDLYISSSIDISSNLTIDVSATTVMTITTNGDLQMLNNRQINFENNAGGTADFWQIFSDTNDDLNIVGNSTTMLFIDNASGFVGIGEINPSYSLDTFGRVRFRGDSGIGGGMFLTESLDDVDNLMYFGRGTDGDGWTGFQDPDTGDWYWVLFDTGFVRIEEAATPSTPVERLEVDGAIVFGNSNADTIGAIRWTGTTFEANIDGTVGGWVDFVSGSTLGGLSDVTITAPSTNDVIYYDGAGWVNGSIPLESLTDVSGGAVVNNFLQYDGADWAPIQLNLNTINDVILTTPSANEVLTYDGSVWRNQAIPGGGGSNAWEVSGGNIVTHSSLANPKVLPETDDTQDLGSATKRWKDLYLGSVIDFSSNLDFAENGTVHVSIASGGELGTKDINISTGNSLIMNDSGFTTTIQPGTLAGNVVLTLPTTTGTLLTTGGNISEFVNDVGYITDSSTDTLTNKTFDANGTGNSISNIDVADLSNGTDGELITWDAAGAPTTIPIGAAGFVLTSNGAGAVPTWQAAAGGGNGIYGGSDSLSGATVVTMATNNLQFDTTGMTGLFLLDAVNDRVLMGDGTNSLTGSFASIAVDQDTLTFLSIENGDAIGTAAEAGLLLGEGVGEFASITRYNTSFSGNHTGTSIARANSLRITNLSSGQDVIYVKADDIYLASGTNTFNPGVALTDDGFFVGQLSSLTTTPVAALQVRGEGTSPTTTAFLVEDNSGTDLFAVVDNGTIGAGVVTGLTARIHTRGSTGTSSTYSFRAENSAGTPVLSARDDVKTVVHGTSASILALDNAGSGNLLQLEAASGSFNTVQVQLGATGNSSGFFTTGTFWTFDENIRIDNSGSQSVIYVNNGGNGLALSGTNSLSPDIEILDTGQIAFFGGTPAAQVADIIALTDSTGGTADNTVAAVSGSGADTTINNNFADIVAKINALRDFARAHSLMA